MINEGWFYVCLAKKTTLSYSFKSTKLYRVIEYTPISLSSDLHTSTYTEICILNLYICILLFIFIFAYSLFLHIIFVLNLYIKFVTVLIALQLMLENS